MIGLAQGVTLVQEFYLPMPEAQLLQGIETASPVVTDTNYYTVNSILTTGNGTVIYYDQWEDGYETNLANPTQPSTQVWGDGDDSNGICPGFTHDPVGIPAGTIITLTNAVLSKPRNPGQLYYDGGDRIAANKALVVTRAGWPSPTGPVAGGAAVVLSTLDFGTNFVSPIGQDMPENLFNYVGFFVMASADNTTVTIDLDGAGPTPPFTVTLNRGQSYLVNGGVMKGGTITTTKPAEANLVCDDTVNTYAYDWFTLYPQSEWSSSYFTPVPSSIGGGTFYTTINYFFNANPNPITILYTNLTGSGTFTVPANGGAEYAMPTNSGASFASAGGEAFTVLTTVAADPTNNPTAGTDTSYNWGYTPLPKGSLTTEAVVGWAPGSSDYTVNGSPVWVTPVANTTIYVAYRGTNTPLTDPAGNKYSTNFTLTALQSKPIYVPGTNDQTGMKVYTLNNTLISVAWGEDPATAPAGNPGLDLGTSVLPFPVPVVKKSSVIITDAPPAGLSVGDTLLYTVETDNKSLLPLGNTVIIDAPSTNLQYVPNSTTMNGFPIPDSTNGFPLSAPGYTIPIILSQGASYFQYEAKVIGSGNVSNTVNIGGTSISATNQLPPGWGSPAPAVSVFKTLMSPATGSAVLGGAVQFNLQVIDSGNTTLPALSLTDAFPSNILRFVAASVPPATTNGGTLTWSNLGDFLPGQNTNITVQFLTIKTNSLATNSATAVSVGGLGGSVTNSGSATVSVAGPPAPGMTVSKTILSPASGDTGMGQTVRYNLQFVNSGNTTLTNVSLLDNFPATNFAFLTASALPSTNSAGWLTWTNIGTFAPGQFTNIAVSFSVTNYSAQLTNFLIAASAGSVTNTNSVALAMTPGALTITKTILSPTNSANWLVGSNLVFRLLIQNTGRVPVGTLPLEDTFSGSTLQYVSASIPPSFVSAGDLYWTNLTASAPLALNATITNDVTMKIIGGPALTANIAAADYAIDTNGAAIAPASGSVSFNVGAAGIGGTVYNDINQSGVYASGDTRLSGVSVSLYAVSNGVPTALLQSIVTDANGNYQLLNLSTGAYFVVEALLPGYVGSAPPNNSVLVNLTSLVSTNINFFQYQTAPANLASISGSVWSDVNGVGFFQAGDTGIANVEVDLLEDLNTNGIANVADPLIQATFTATNGLYSFGGVVPGNYIIREIVLSNYVATSPSQLGRGVAAGTVTNGNDFFNFFVGSGNSNSAPVAVPDFASTFVNVPLTLAPLTNDSSPGGFALTITNVAATNGTAVILGGTNVLFTPATNFSGTATIGYTVTNVNGKSTSLITVTVLPLADLKIGKSAPASIAASSNLTYTISVTNFGPSTAAGVTVTDSLPAGVSFVNASGGGLNNSGVVTWALGSLASGSVSNVTVMVAVPVSGSLTNIASVGSPVTDPNLTNNVTPPVVTAVTPVADLTIGKTGAASGTLGAGFNYTISVTNLGPSVAANFNVTDSLPAGILLVGSLPAASTNSVNQVVWTNISALAAGATMNFTLTVQAATRGTVTNLASVGGPTLDPVPTNNTSLPVVTSITNRPPIAVNDNASTARNVAVTIPVLANDSDPDGDVLTIVAVNPTNGVATISGANIIYTPTNGVPGTNVFNYTISDGFGGTNSALVTVYVTNRPPVAVNDTASTARNVAVTIPVLANDSDPDGDALTIVSVNPTNGIASISGASIIYTPTNVVPGTNVFGYTISDGIGGTNSALVTVYVTNRPPVAVNDTASSARNVAVTIPVVANDSDPDGDALTIVSVNPTNGTASVSGASIIYTPTNVVPGTNVFGYTVSDGFGGTNSALVTVYVTNRPPVAVNDTASTPENVAVPVPVLVNDSDPDGDPIIVVSVNPTNGMAVISGTNIIFTPTTNFVGTATVGYSITDNFGGTNSAVITISVTNRPPLANPDSYAIIENTTNTFAVLVNDLVQTPGGSLGLVFVTTTNGAAAISGTNIVFTPAVNYLGALTLTYTISDNVGGTNSSFVTVLVTNVPPVANPDSVTVLENSTNTLTPLTNDLVMTSGGSLQIVGVSTTNGTVTILDLTNVVYTPPSNFVGNATVDYTISDGIGGTNSSLITITVLPVADLAASKMGPATVQAAMNFDYTITVTNLGPGTAASLSVTDNLPAAVGFVSSSAGAVLNGSQLVWTNLGSLAAKTATNLTVTVTAPVASVSLTNGASVGSPTSDPNLTNNTSLPVVTAVAATADLAIVKTGPATVSAAGNIVYTISVTNFGPASANAVVVTDTLPVGVSFVNASGNGANDSGVVSWGLGVLAAGQWSNLTVAVTAPTAGTLTNIASVSSPSADTNLLNNTTPPVVTTVIPLADLTISKTGPANVLAGGNVNYTISVTNLGPSDASSVLVTDTLPVGVSFVNSSGGGVNYAGAVVWSLDTLAAGQSSNITLTVTAPASGGLTNVASVSSPIGDPNPTNNLTPPVITSVTPVADLAVGKTGAAASALGVNFNCTISVTNLGPSAAADFNVTDSLPAGIVLVSALPAATTNAANQVVWSGLGALAANETANFTLTVQAVSRGSMTNLASVGGPTLDPALTNNTSLPVVTSITNRPPVAVNDTASTARNVAVTIPVLANDSDPDGDSLAIVSVNPTNGIASVSGANIIYTPTNGVPGTNVYGYTISDGFGGTNSALVTVYVTNRPPVAVNDMASTARNVAVTIPVLANDSDPDGDALTIVSLNPTNGIASISGASIIYTPTNGVPGTNVFGYTISDGFGGTNSALVTVYVTNRPPVAVNDTGSTARNVAVTIPVLANDSDPDGDALTIVSVNPTNGIASISGASIIYTPTNGVPGTNVFGYTISDGFGGTNSALVTVYVTNRPPVAVNDTGSTARNVAVTIPVLANDSDPDGDPLTIVAANPTNGIASISGANIIYTPTNGVPGTNVFGYTISDGFGGTNSALVTVYVTNRPPVAVNDAASTARNMAVTIPVLANDSDPDGDALTIVAVNPTNGIASISGANIIYTPTNGVPGTNVFGYTISDGFGGTNSALVTVYVTNRPPVAVNDAASTARNMAVTIPVLANDSDPDGDPLTIVAANPTNGIASISGANIIYTPTNAVPGTNVFGYTISDGFGGTNSALVTVYVTNRPPVAVNDTASTPENVSVTVPVLVNDSDPDGDVLNIISAGSTNGTAIISGTNIVFRPATNFVGTATANYSISDAFGGTNSAVITVLVTNVPPVANPDNYTVGENSGVSTLNPLANDVVRTPGGILSLLSVSSTNGTAAISGTNVLFTPVTNFFGLATIGYVITDGIGGTSSSLIFVNVTNVPPLATGQSVSTAENVALQIILTGSDPNHLPLTFAIVGNSANGIVSNLNTNTGVLTYQPGTNYTGADSFTFLVNNGQTNSAPATVNVTVAPVADLVVVESGPATGYAGSNLVFTVSVTNRGPATATSLVISNQLASGFTFVSASAGGADAGKLVTWNLASLPANGVTNLTVTAFATEGGAFTNIASGASAVLDLNPTNNNGSLASARTLTVLTPVADLVVFKNGGTNVYAGATVNYTITASNAGPSTATSTVIQDTLPAGAVFQSASGSYSFTNGVVTWSGLTLAPGAVTTFNISVVASPSVTSFINVASGTSPVLDPNATNNNGSFAASRVTTKVTPSADVIDVITGPASAIIGSNMVFTVNITNAGPSTASNVVVSDSLPASLVLVSASAGGVTNASRLIVWPAITSLPVGGNTNFTFTVRSLSAGTFTNVVASTSTTFDPNPTNNTGVLPVAQALTQVTLPQFTLSQGTAIFNPQTGLFEQQVTVTNSGVTTVAGIQLYVSGLRSSATLHNASGTNGGVPYVQYSYPLNPSDTVHFVLEFYDTASRQSFSDTLWVVALTNVVIPTTGVTNSVPVNRVFTDTRTSPTRFVIEWASVIGKTYTVIYADNVTATNWYIGTPSVTASANVTQWYDDGPPKTMSAPMSASTRFYRVIQNN